MVSYGADARFVMSWMTNPQARFYNSVEFLEPSGDRWAAGVIDFSGAAPVVRYPDACSTCHGSLNKPLWGRNGQMPGTEADVPSGNGLYSFTSATAYENLKKARSSSDPRIAPLMFSVPDPPHYRSGISQPIAYPRDAVGGFTSAARDAAMTMQWRHEQVLFQRAASQGQLGRAQRNRVICPLGDSSGPVNVPMSLPDAHLSMRADTREYLEGVTNPQNNGYCSDVYHCMEPDFHLLVLHDMYQRSSMVRQSLRNSASWQELAEVHHLAFGGHGRANNAARTRAGTFAAYVRNEPFRDSVEVMKEAGVCAVLQGEGPEGLGLSGPPGIGPLGVGGFTLVGSDGAEADIGEEAVLRHGGRESVRFNLEAEVASDTDAESVRIALIRDDLAVRHEFTDNTAPFSLFARADCGATIPAGNYLVSATAYSQPHGQGEAGPSFTLGFVVRSGSSATVADKVCPPSTAAVVPVVPQISVSGSGSVTEGGAAEFSLVAAPPPAAPLAIVVDVTQIGGFASAGRRTVTMPASGTARLRVDTTADMIDAEDGSVTATVVARSGYTVLTSRASASVAVLDDDLPSDALTLSISPQRVDEGSGSVVLTAVVGLDGAALRHDTSVTVAVGTNGTAVEDMDYRAVRPLRVRLPAGSRSATGRLVLTLIDDGRNEADETVVFTASPTFVGGLRSAQGTVTIADNDGPVPEVSVLRTTGLVAEGEAAEFTITANPPPAESLAVRVAVTQVGDFAQTGVRMVTVPTAGTASLRVPTVDDRLHEADGSVTATVVVSDGYTVSSSSGSATVSVSDDDRAPTALSLAVSPQRVDEGSGAVALTLTVGLDGSPLAQDELITLSVGAGGTAVAGMDYQAVQPLAVRLPKGRMSATGQLSFVPIDDNRAESDETVRLTATAMSGALRSADASITVVDNDGSARDPGVSVTRVGGTSITEGDTARFTVQADAAMVRDLWVDFYVQETGQFLSSGQGGRRSVLIRRGSRAAEIQVGTDDDGVDEERGVVKVQVVSGSGYEVRSPELASVLVEDNDDGARRDPEVSLHSTTGSLAEGAVARFTITVSPPPVTPLTVRVAVTQKGDFASAGVRMVTVPTSGTASLRVTTVDDELEEVDGSVTATLVAGDGYTVSSSRGSSTIAVDDNDRATRTLTLRVRPQRVEEGSASVALTLTVALDGPPLVRDELVTLAVGEGGSAVEGVDYRAVRPVAVRLRAGSQFATGQLAFVPIDDTRVESDESVRLTATAMSGGLRYADTTVMIVDDDQPASEPEISVTSTAGSLVEGMPAVFTITANPAPVAPLTVRVGITQDGDFASGGMRTVRVPTSGTARLRVDTVDDDIHESDGSVTATVAVGTGYTVSSARGSATIGVADDDIPSRALTLSLSRRRVDEGSGAVALRVTVGMDGAALTRSVSATVTVGTGGTADRGTDYQSVQPLSLLIRAGQRSATETLVFQPIDDDLDEADETVRLTAEEIGGGLRSAVATFSIVDDDEPARVPEVSVTTGGSGSITEGGTASFTITANPAPVAPLTVRVGITQDGDFASEGMRTVRVPTSGTARLRVDTADDDIHESDGSVTATLAAGTGYTVSSARGSATIRVADDDIPSRALTLSLSRRRVDEGSGAVALRVTVGMDGAALTRSVSATVTVGTGGTADRGTDYQSVQPLSLLIRAGQRSATETLVFQPIDDDLDEADETVRLTAEEIGGGLRSAVATFSIVDDDEPARVPEVSVITGGSGSITEGGTASFTIRADPAPDHNLSVRLYVSQAGDFVHSQEELPSTVTIRPGTNSAQVDLRTDDDQAKESDGLVRVQVLSGQGYRVGASSIASVDVRDNDNTPDPQEKPVISVSQAGSKWITEGSTATFTVRADPAPDEDLEVSLFVDEVGEVLRSGERGGRRAQIGGNTNSVTVDVHTEDDSTAERDGVVKVYVVPRERYVVGSSGLASVGVQDNDQQPSPKLTVTPTSLVAEEGGLAGSYSVALSEEPLANVNVTVTVAAPSVAQVSSPAESAGQSASLTFTPQNWSSPQSVSVVPQDDVDSADGATKITHAVRGSGQFARLAAPSVTVVVADDDVSDAEEGLVLTVVPNSVREDAGKVRLQIAVALNGEPVDVARMPEGTPVTVYALENAGTAEPGVGYQPLAPTTVLIPPGARIAVEEVEFEVIDNESPESARHLVLEARPPDSLPELGTSRAALTIVDDDSGLPGEPTALVATSVDSSSVRLTWLPPQDQGHSRVAGYMVEASPDGKNWHILRINTGNRVTAYTDTNLSEGEVRHYRVAAITLHGTGQPSLSTTGTAVQ